jgi:3-methyladenine DNA glycosylase AlkD
MTVAQALAALEKAGTVQNRKVYARHGVGPAQFGVSFAELKKLARAIRQDHALAVGLWASGNHDARVLATMVADPGAFSARDLDAWAKDLDNYVIVDAFAALVARSPLAAARSAAWRGRKGEWVAAAGWNVVSGLALRDDTDEASLAPLIGTIAAGIHDQPNRVRHAMNTTLISIGARGGALEKAALAAAARIGKVTVDHGETGCRTPDAADYIRRTVAHRRRKG